MKLFIKLLITLFVFLFINVSKAQNLKLNIKLSNYSKKIKDGHADIKVSGGKEPYTYKWSDRSTALTSFIAEGLTEGKDYKVVVTDADGLKDSINFIIEAKSADEKINSFFVPLVAALEKVLMFLHFLKTSKVIKSIIVKLKLFEIECSIMKLFPIHIIFLVMTNQSFAQDHNSSQKPELRYYQIPDYPASFTAENVTARMVDGLGYRYFWATKELRQEDLAYRPSTDSRTTGETIDHIYGLSKMILKRLQNKDIPSKDHMDFEEKRKNTLDNFWSASQILKGEDTNGHGIDFQKDNNNGYPFWNMINGPISDAIYHTGQVVSYRRASGNPIFQGVRVFSGKTKE
ncbi:MAG: SprB repeat-containing protein [Bacteroidales bacterium]|nr:SprB repeat-containing protein [Bacteroidales bacterium]